MHHAAPPAASTTRTLSSTGTRSHRSASAAASAAAAAARGDSGATSSAAANVTTKHATLPTSVLPRDAVPRAPQLRRRHTPSDDRRRRVAEPRGEHRGDGDRTRKEHDREHVGGEQPARSRPRAVLALAQQRPDGAHERRLHARRPQPRELEARRGEAERGEQREQRGARGAERVRRRQHRRRDVDRLAPQLGAQRVSHRQHRQHRRSRASRHEPAAQKLLQLRGAL